MKKSILTTALLGTLAFGTDVSNFDILGITLNHTSKQAMAIAQKQGYKCEDKMDGYYATGLKSLTQHIQCTDKNEQRWKTLTIWYDTRDFTIWNIGRSEMFWDKNLLDIDTFYKITENKYGQPDYVDQGYRLYSKEFMPSCAPGGRSGKCLRVNANEEKDYKGILIDIVDATRFNNVSNANEMRYKEMKNQQKQKTKEATSNMQL